jgi:hypothetical protein
LPVFITTIELVLLLWRLPQGFDRVEEVSPQDREDGVAQLVMEDGDGPGELIGSDERFERKHRWPWYGESAPKRLNPKRDESSPGMGPKSWLAATKGWRGITDGRGPARGRRRLNLERSKAVTWRQEELHVVNVDWESSIINLDYWGFMACSHQ